MGSKCLFSTIMFTKHLITLQNLVLSEKNHSRPQIERYILPCCAIFMDLLLQKRTFWVLKGVKMPIFYNNLYKTPYNCTKPGLIGNISFQTTNRKIYITILCNMYGSTGPKMTFWVLKGVKIPMFYNNVY